MSRFDPAIGRMLAELGLASVGRGFIEDTIGRGGEHLIRNTLARAGADAGRYPQAWASYQAHSGAVNGEFSATEQTKSLALLLATLGRP